MQPHEPLNENKFWTVDWEGLRHLSLRPGGFREQRRTLWPQLLNVDQNAAIQVAHEDDTLVEDRTALLERPGTDEQQSEATEPHPDERQVRLDTDRSFVLYPVAGMKARMKQQNELHDLIVSVFRKRRRLSYFQGYHDIISVIFLTLPQEMQLPAAEKFSLHRVRDSMGVSLEPVVGLLRVLKRLLTLADPEYATLLEQQSPLPYYALSNLLTLFSHDMPTLPLIQHVFDYLLCRPPILVVYLAAAVVLSRKQEVQRLEQEGEEGLIHSLLSGLPDIYDEVDSPHDLREQTVEQDVQSIEEPGPESIEHAPAAPEDKVGVTPEMEYPCLASANDSEAEETAVSDDETLPPTEGGTTVVSDTDSWPCSPKVRGVIIERGEQSEAGLDPPHKQLEKASSADEICSENDNAEILAPNSHSPSTRHDREQTASASTSSSSPDHPAKPRVSLSTLLERADEIYTLYPPTHPDVCLHTIMGPQSAVFTWSENFRELPSDDGAELMVTQPHLIVLPAPPEEFEDKEKEEREEDERKVVKRSRRKLRKPIRLGSLTVERRAVVASAVLVLGVAMAVYGMQVVPERQHGAAKELRKLTRYVGGLVLGMSGKLWEGLLAGRSSR